MTKLVPIQLREKQKFIPPFVFISLHTAVFSINFMFLKIRRSKKQPSRISNCNYWLKYLGENRDVKTKGDLVAYRSTPNSSTNTISKQSPFFERATYHRARKYRLKIFSGEKTARSPPFFFFHRWLVIIDDHQRYALDKARRSSHHPKTYVGQKLRRGLHSSKIRVGHEAFAPRLSGLSRAMGRKERGRRERGVETNG